MACYYNIKLPNGGEVKLPATFSTISESSTSKDVMTDLNQEIENYYTNPEELTPNTSIISFLKDLGTGLETNTLKKIVQESSASTLVDNLNEEITSIAGTSNLVDALKKHVLNNNGQIIYINKKGNEESITLPDFLNKLSSPIGKKYFNAIQSENLLNVQKLPNITKDIDISIQNLAEVGISRSNSNSLKNILNKAFYQDRTNNIFLNIDFNTDIHDAVVVHPEDSKSPLIFYNGLNDLSLFMGVFKHLASKIDKDKLLPILQDYNNELLLNEKSNKDILDLNNLNSEKFFIGEFTNSDNDKIKFIDPDFNKVFKYKNNSENVINRLIDLITSDFSLTDKTKASLTYDFKTLFKFVDPNKYGKSINIDEQTLLNTYMIEQKENRELTNELKGQKLLPFINKEKRDYYYSTPKQVNGFENSEDTYNYLINNIVKGEDLLTVKIEPKGEKPFLRLLVPTEYKIQNYGVQVRGFYENDGKLVWENRGVIHNSTSKDPVKISHRESTNELPIIDPQNSTPLSSKDSIIIIAPDGKTIPKELVESAAVRGGAIISKKDSSKIGENGITEDTRIIKGVYPGVIKGNSYMTKKTKFKEAELVEPSLGTNNVIRLITDKNKFKDEFTESDIERKKELINSSQAVTPNGNFYPIDAGDYILSKTTKGQLVYNTVIATADNDAYILIKTGDGKYLAKTIPKKTILTIYKKPIDFNLPNLEDIARFHKKISEDKSISDMSFSSIDNYEAAKKGDYLVSKNLDNDSNDYTYTIYKITNKEKKEGIQLVLSNDDKKVIRQQYSPLPDLAKDYIIVTNRNIYTENGIGNAELNNVYLTTKINLVEANNIKYVEVKYFVPKGQANEYELLNSGNLISGLFRPIDKSINDEDSIRKSKNILFSKTLPENYANNPVTEDLISMINDKRKTNGTKLYIKVKDSLGEDLKNNPNAEKRKDKTEDGKGYYMRYNNSLWQVDYTPDKNIYLQEHAFIVLKNPIDTTITGSKTYRIIGRTDDMLSLEYNTFNQAGKLLSIQKQLNLTKDADGNSDENKIKYLYVMKESNSYKKLTAIKKNIKLSSATDPIKEAKEIELERKGVINSVYNAFDQFIKIPVSIENHSEKEFKDKKAWISAENSPKIILNLTNENMTKQDLVHEYLHLFLMALKYNSPRDSVNKYENLLRNYQQTFSDLKGSNPEESIKINNIVNTNDWSKIEEYFVNDISRKMNEGNLSDIINYKLFSDAFSTSLKNIGIDNFDVIDNDAFSILNYKMASIFTKDKNVKLINKGLVLFEVNFREWLSNKIESNDPNDKIEVIC